MGKYVKVLCLRSSPGYQEGSTYEAEPHDPPAGVGYYGVISHDRSRCSFYLLGKDPDFVIDPEQDG
jgi:hypothetical protein